jgi:hypothetical protein
MLVLLLGIFRSAPRPATTRGALVPFYFPGGALFLKIILLIIYDTISMSHLKCLKSSVSKLMGKHFIDPKSKMSEILSVIQVFPCTTQIALF